MDPTQKKLTSTAKKAARDSEILSQVAGHARINHCHIFCSFWKNAKKNFHEYADSSGFSISTDFLSSLMDKYSSTYPDDCILTVVADEKSSFDRIMPAAFLLADRLGHEFVGVEHILFGCLVSDDNFADFLLKQDIDTEHLKTCLKKFIEGRHLVADNGEMGDEEEDELNGSVLESYCTNFNELVTSEDFPPIFVRKDEIEQMEQILCRKTKSNCILLGEAGAGKTSIVEGLAQLIQEEDYNGPLKDHLIYALDLAKMLAGTQWRGQFEKRFKCLLTALEEYDNIIIFIDEAHAIIGAGSKEGSFDLANMLKPALARGSIKCIAATTQDEYTKHIEKDPALSRRFQPVFVKEPSDKDMATMMKFALSSYEEHHGIVVSDKIIEQMVKLCSIYLVGKKFPDKGFDILDQAMAYCRLNSKRKKLSINDVVAVIAKRANVSKSSVIDTINFKFADFEKEVLKEVYGQQEAVNKVFNALVCAKAGLRNKKKPLASLFFVGPTGVGKTYLAKKIAKEYFGNEENLLQLNLTEFTDSGAVAQLIGASVGYIGHDQGGQLTKFVHKRPNSVILFDEADKCHDNVHNLLLQIMDEGRITDGAGRSVDFSQTIIILTSNGFNKPKPSIGFAPSKENAFEQSIKDNLPKEFVARVDEIIPFSELTKDSLRKILDEELGRISDETKAKVIVDNEVYDFILNDIFNAREVSNAAKRLITIPTAKYIVSHGEIKKIDVKVLDKKLNIEYI